MSLVLLKEVSSARVRGDWARVCALLRVLCNTCVLGRTPAQKLSLACSEDYLLLSELEFVVLADQLGGCDVRYYMTIIASLFRGSRCSRNNTDERKEAEAEELLGKLLLGTKLVEMCSAMAASNSSSHEALMAMLDFDHALVQRIRAAGQQQQEAWPHALLVRYAEACDKCGLAAAVPRPPAKPKEEENEEDLASALWSLAQSFVPERTYPILGDGSAWLAWVLARETAGDQRIAVDHLLLRCQRQGADLNAARRAQICAALTVLAMHSRDATNLFALLYPTAILPSLCAEMDNEANLMGIACSIAAISKGSALPGQILASWMRNKPRITLLFAQAPEGMMHLTAQLLAAAGPESSSISAQLQVFASQLVPYILQHAWDTPQGLRCLAALLPTNDDILLQVISSPSLALIANRALSNKAEDNLPHWCFLESLSFACAVYSPSGAEQLLLLQANNNGLPWERLVCLPALPFWSNLLAAAATNNKNVDGMDIRLVMALLTMIASEVTDTSDSLEPALECMANLAAARADSPLNVFKMRILNDPRLVTLLQSSSSSSSKHKVALRCIVNLAGFPHRVEEAGSLRRVKTLFGDCLREDLQTARAVSSWLGL